MGEFYCELCNTKFTRLRNLSKHMKNKHPSDDSGVMQCEEPGCAYKTMTKHCMQRHVEKVHLGIRLAMLNYHNIQPLHRCYFIFIFGSLGKMF